VVCVAGTWKTGRSTKSRMKCIPTIRFLYLGAVCGSCKMKIVSLNAIEMPANMAKKKNQKKLQGVE